MRSTSDDPRKKAVKSLDLSFGKMIKERDADLLCIACGKQHQTYEAGHYRSRDCMSTRFDPRNVNKEGFGCNRGHATKYGVKDMDLYRENLDKKWGKGTADELYAKSKELRQWDLNELNLLKDAAKRGIKVYEQIYKEIA
jgi:hypothetical protein